MCPVWFWNTSSQTHLYFIKLKQRKSQQWRRIGYPVLISIDFDNFTSVSVYSLLFVLIEKIYQTLETMFHRLSKHIKFCQKCSPVHHIFNSILSVWISRWNTVSHGRYATHNSVHNQPWLRYIIILSCRVAVRYVNVVLNAIIYLIQHVPCNTTWDGHNGNFYKFQSRHTCLRTHRRVSPRVTEISKLKQFSPNCSKCKYCLWVKSLSS